MIKKFKKFLLEHSIFKPKHMGTWIRNLYFDFYLRRKIDLSKIKKVLDAGCGKGAYANKLANFLKKSDVAAVDIKNFPEWNNYKQKNLSFRKMDLGKLKEKNFYNLIVSIDSLEHIPDNKKILKFFFDALHSKGILYLATPCEKNEMHIFPKKWFKSFYQWAKNEHIGEQYKLKELKSILKKLGFHIIFSRYTFTFWGNLAWEMEFLFRNMKNGRFNILMMPLFKFLGYLDLLLPIGKGNNLIIVQKP